MVICIATLNSLVRCTFVSRERLRTSNIGAVRSIEFISLALGLTLPDVKALGLADASSGRIYKDRIASAAVVVVAFCIVDVAPIRRAAWKLRADCIYRARLVVRNTRSLIAKVCIRAVVHSCSTMIRHALAVVVVTQNAQIFGRDHCPRGVVVAKTEGHCANNSIFIRYLFLDFYVNLLVKAGKDVCSIDAEIYSTHCRVAPRANDDAV